MSQRVKYTKRKIKNVKLRRDRKRKLKLKNKKRQERKQYEHERTFNTTANKEFLNESFDPSTIYQAAPTCGSIEFVSGADFEIIVSRIIIFLISIINDNEKSYIFPNLTVIIPMTGMLKDQDVWRILHTSFGKLSGLGESDRYLLHLKSRINIIKLINLNKNTLISNIESLEPNSAFVVLECHLYLKMIDEEYRLPPGRSEISLEEDSWVPNIVEICEEIIAICKKNHLYGVIHTSKNSPTREANSDLINSVQDCYPIFFSSKIDINQVIIKYSQNWLDLLLTEGEVSVKDSMQRLGLTIHDANLALAQLWNRLENIEELKCKLDLVINNLSPYSPQTHLKVAHMCSKCYLPEITASIFPDAITVHDKDSVYLGLDTATKIRNNTLITSYYKRLLSLDPSSIYLRQNVEERMLHISSTSDNESISKLGFTIKDSELLSDILSECFDFDEVIKLVRTYDDIDDDLKYLCIALRAMHKGRFDISCILSIILIRSRRFQSNAAFVLYTSSKNIFLTGSFSLDQIENNLVSLEALVKYQSKAPEDFRTRQSISRLLSVETSGKFGRPLAIALALKTTPNFKNQDIYISPESSNFGIQEEDAFEAIKEAMKSVAKRGLIEIGVTILPASLVANKADAIINAIYKMIDYQTKTSEMQSDFETMELLATICSAVYTYSKNKNNQDLRLVKYLASAYAQNGHYDKARNLSEQLLITCGDNQKRLRLAWLCYADVQNRCRNNTESLVGLSCLYSLNTSIDIRDAWDELHVLIRVLRDINLIEYSNKLMPILKILTEKQGMNQDEDLRIVGLQDSIDIKLSINGSADSLFTLIEKLCKKCEKFSDKNELTPIVMLLAQCIAKLKDSGIQPTTYQVSTLEGCLVVCDQEIRDAAKLIYEDNPDITVLSRIYNSIIDGESWHPSSNDLNILELISRRIISFTRTCIESKVLAFEILCDQSFFGNSESYIDSESLKIDLAGISEKGHAVLYLALDINDNLVGRFVENGTEKTLRWKSSSDKSYKDLFENWSNDFPYNYGFIDPYNGNNEFITSLEGFLFTLPKTGSLLVIAEPYLQRLPVGLMTADCNGAASPFLGHQTKITNLPSLTWLTTSKRGVEAGKIEKFSAWIPITAEAEVATLNTLHLRLSGILEDYSFTINTTPSLPDTIDRSKVAIVAAHGGLMPEGEFIHRVSDDAKNIISPQVIANAVSGSDIVILFICSGGRVDKNPTSNRSYGLPIEILKRGAASVLASPWPLDVKVTYNWLEVFLEEMTSGATVSNANFIANRRLLESLGDFAGYSLAMTLYGDPDVKL